ncbi:MAG: hypothetical protein JW741_15665 [Sedimentisphaerales bacterium]|nr:hypothetical protein [Sedimentisphaerales bacterium]
MIKLLKENKEWLFSGAGLTFVTSLFLVIRWVIRRIANRPTLDEVEVSLNIHAPNTRTCSGSFVFLNPANVPLSISIELKSNVPLPPVNLVSLKGRPLRGKVDSTVQNQPILVPIGAHHVYFLTEELATVYQGTLPGSVELRVRVVKGVLLRRTLKKDGVHHYS